MLCRVYQKPDGSVVVLHPVPKMRLPDEPEADFLARIAARDAPKTGLHTLPYCDMETSQLPARKDRKQWDVDVVKKEVKVKAK